MKDKNGLLPGWPPFNKFKKEMADLVSTVVDEKTKPLSDDLHTVKNSLIDHINKTDANFKTVKQYLSNHVTETDKKIDKLNTDVSELKSDMKIVKEAVLKK